VKTGDLVKLLFIDYSTGNEPFGLILKYTHNNIRPRESVVIIFSAGKIIKEYFEDLELITNI
jgi:hypothetical protein